MTIGRLALTTDSPTPPALPGEYRPLPYPFPSETARLAVCTLLSRQSFAFRRRDVRPLSPHSADAPFRRRVAPALAPGGSRNGTPAAIKFNLTNVILLDSFYTVLFELCLELRIISRAFPVPEHST